MAEPNVSKTAVVVATPEVATKYITNALVNGKLHMKAACKELGWSFPRIRSRALTIAKKMKCTFMKTSRGVYILGPLNPLLDPTASVVEDSTEINSDTLIAGEDVDDEDDTDEDDTDEVEAALLSNGSDTLNV